MMKPARRAGESSSGSTFICARGGGRTWRGVGWDATGTETQGTTFVTTLERKEGLMRAMAEGGLMMVDEESGLRR